MEVVAASYVAEDEVNLKATELRLGLPGTEEEKTTTTALSLLPTPPSTPRGKKRDVTSGAEEAAAHTTTRDGETALQPPAAKAQAVGWPPVRSYRKSCFQQQAQATKNKPAAAAPEEPAGGALFVKVSMDGAPYLRKVDLKMYKGYRELREALEAMFLRFSGGANDAPSTRRTSPSPTRTRTATSCSSATCHSTCSSAPARG